MSETKVYRDRNIQIIFGVTLMAVMGVSSIAPVFPRLVQELGVTTGQIGLLITFFTLPGIFLAPVLGLLADRFGRKRVLGPSLFLFALAGAACAFTNDFSLYRYTSFAMVNIDVGSRNTLHDFIKSLPASVPRKLTIAPKSETSILAIYL